METTVSHGCKIVARAECNSSSLFYPSRPIRLSISFIVEPQLVTRVKSFAGNFLSADRPVIEISARLRDEMSCRNSCALSLRVSASLLIWHSSDSVAKASYATGLHAV